MIHAIDGGTQAFLAPESLFSPAIGNVAEIFSPDAKGQRRDDARPSATKKKKCGRSCTSSQRLFLFFDHQGNMQPFGGMITRTNNNPVNSRVLYH